MSRHPKELLTDIIGRLINGTDTPAEEKEEERVMANL
jgi:hypothetical protein